MPRMDGVAAAALITSRHPALAGGAVGYLLKDAGPAEVATAIHAAARDGTYLDPAIARRQLSERARAPCARSDNCRWSASASGRSP
jgi:DNA-binding NarL/FixJ family response regulator